MVSPKDNRKAPKFQKPSVTVQLFKIMNLDKTEKSGRANPLRPNYWDNWSRDEDTSQKKKTNLFFIEYPSVAAG